MQNKLSDLNNHLFVEMERLNNEELKGEALQEEIKRSRALTGIASQIIQNGHLVMRALKVKDDMGGEIKLPPMLEAGDEKPAQVHNQGN
jgi:hypothetical protein